MDRTTAQTLEPKLYSNIPIGLNVLLLGYGHSSGEYFNDDIGTGEILRNTRIGATFAVPINKHQSIKLYDNKGINTRYGTDFDAIGISWQYAWAG